MTGVHDALACALLANVPVALRGRPGVGKTAMVERVAATLGWHLEVVVGSLRDPTDFAGLPVVQPDGTVRLAPPQWVRDANAATGGAVVFLDELTTASPTTQSAMLRVLRERVVGDLPLEPHVRLVAAYNDADDCGGFDLELPVRSRLCHLEVVVDVDTVVKGLLGAWPAVSVAEPPSARTLHKWERTWRRTLTAFLRARPSLCEAAPGAWGSYPTPRTWEMAAVLAATADACGAGDEVRNLLLAGVLGPGAAAEVISYAAALDLPDPAAVLADPRGFPLPLDPRRPDRMWALLSSVVDTAVARRDPDAWAAAWIVAARVAEAGAGDVAVWLTNPLIGSRPDGAAIPPEYQHVRSFLGRAA